MLTNVYWYEFPMGLELLVEDGQHVRILFTQSLIFYKQNLKQNIQSTVCEGIIIVEGHYLRNKYSTFLDGQQFLSLPQFRKDYKSCKGDQLWKLREGNQVCIELHLFDVDIKKKMDYLTKITCLVDQILQLQNSLEWECLENLLHRKQQIKREQQIEKREQYLWASQSLRYYITFNHLMKQYCSRSQPKDYQTQGLFLRRGVQSQENLQKLSVTIFQIAHMFTLASKE
eukprot:TRINITY_DN1527_c1_g1_i2.p1 TRINITY_DN1527_c1_g1~~TRINITY_DN1527_c1_g1_i2.p1  ORF type:complete len:228 (-),score=1.88 TRINITY_DN1527_c1_g1_i2:214-897(-)